MALFPLHDEDTAPTSARAAMQSARETFGFVPNLIRGMAESPALVNGYLSLSEKLGNSGLTPQEQQVVLLAVSRYNRCDYCVAAHSMGARMAKVDPETVDALRDDQPAEDPRLQALRAFSYKIAEQRGWLSEDDVQAFLDAGFQTTHIGDVILAVGMKTLSNYFNHIAQTPLDEAMKSYAWSDKRRSE